MSAPLLPYMAPQRFLEALHGRVRGVVVGHGYFARETAPLWLAGGAGGRG